MSDQLDEGLRWLLDPPTRKRKRQSCNSSSEALECIKKGVRYASNPALAVHKVVSALEASLHRPKPPMHHVISVLSCLFDRSKLFRDEFIQRMHPFFASWTKHSLYSVELLEMLHAWDAKHNFPTLHVAIQAIPTKAKALLVDKQQKEAARKNDAEATAAMRRIQYMQMVHELGEAEKALEHVIQEMEAGLELLVPSVDNCFEALLPTFAPYEDASDDGEEWEDVYTSSVVTQASAENLSVADVIAQCGLGSASYSLTITLPEMNTENLTQVHTVIRDGAKQLRKRFVPLLRQWKSLVDDASDEVGTRLDTLAASVQRVLLKWDEFNDMKRNTHE